MDFRFLQNCNLKQRSAEGGNLGPFQNLQCYSPGADEDRRIHGGGGLKPPFSDEKSPPKLILVSFLLFFPVNSWRYLQKFTATPPKTNMEPQNWWFVDVSPFLRVYFQVPCWFSGVYLLHQPPRFAQMSGTFDAGGVRWIPRRASEIKRALVFLRGANLGWFQDANNLSLSCWVWVKYTQKLQQIFRKDSSQIIDQSLFPFAQQLPTFCEQLPFKSSWTISLDAKWGDYG